MDTKQLKQLADYARHLPLLPLVLPCQPRCTNHPLKYGGLNGPGIPARFQYVVHPPGEMPVSTAFCT